MLPASSSLPALEEFEVGQLDGTADLLCAWDVGCRRATAEAADLIPQPTLASEASDPTLLEPGTSFGWRRRNHRVLQLSAEDP